MPRKYSLSTKLVSIGAALLIVALTSIGLTLWVTWQLEGGAAAVNEAGRLRMQTWRLASVAQSSHATVVAELVAQFDQSLALLKSGDASRPLFLPMDDKVSQHFAEVQALWAENRPLWLGQSPPDVDAALAVTASQMANADLNFSSLNFIVFSSLFTTNNYTAEHAPVGAAGVTILRRSVVPQQPLAIRLDDGRLPEAAPGVRRQLHRAVAPGADQRLDPVLAAGDVLGGVPV